MNTGEMVFPQRIKVRLSLPWALKKNEKFTAMRSHHHLFSLVLLVCCMGFQTTEAQEHVVLNTFGVGIYTQPSEESTLVFSAGKSTIFALQEVGDQWVAVELYSGATRYIKRSQVYILDTLIPAHQMTLPKY
jgi:hypothetical protein